MAESRSQSEHCVLPIPLSSNPTGKLAVEALGLQPSQTVFCDDACLCRYLRARDWNIGHALKLLQGTLVWRQEFGVDEIHPETLLEESKTGKLYIHGFDRHRRPVMYQKPRRQNTKDYKNQVRQVVYMLEREVASMELDAGVEQHVLLIDFKDYSIFNAPPMAVTQEVLTVLMDYYPERLGNAFMVDAPMLFSMCWRVLKPFLPKVPYDHNHAFFPYLFQATQEKVHFVSRQGKHGRHGKMDKVLAEFFDDDHLEEEYGGTLPSTYNHDLYWSREIEIWKQWKELRAPSSKVDSV